MKNSTLRMLSLCSLCPLAVLLAASLAGCRVGPHASHAGDTLDTDSATNSMRMAADAYTANYTGTTPTGVVVDGGGANILSGQPHRTTGASIPLRDETGAPFLDGNGDAVAVKFFNIDPGDSGIEGWTISMGTDGTLTSELTGLSVSQSAPIAANNAAVVAALEAAAVITAEQAETARAALDAGKGLAEALAEIGVRLAVPVTP